MSYRTDGSDSQAEAIAERLTDLLKECKGIDIEDETVDDCIIKLMDMLSEAYQEGYSESNADEGIAHDQLVESQRPMLDEWRTELYHELNAYGSPSMGDAERYARQRKRVQARIDFLEPIMGLQDE
jgi:hypothetical protein